MSKRTLKLKSDLDELARLATAIEEACVGQPEDSVGHVQLAAEELVTNVIVYADTVAKRGAKVELQVDGSRFWMRVTDWGPPFDPMEKADPDVSVPVEERRVGGLGILLVKKLMDEFRYRRVGERNVVEIVKSLSPAGTGE